MSDPVENHIGCPDCGAVYDITGIEAGSTFECEACSATVQVPHPDEAPPVSAATPRHPGRPSRQGSRRRAEAPPPAMKRGSPALLLVATVVGVVAVAVIAFLLLKDSGGPEEKDLAGGVRTSKTEEASAGTEKEPVNTGELPHHYAKLRKAAEASGSARDWYDLACWCDENGYRSDKRLAEKLYKRILRKIDTNHPGARKKLGYTLYDGDIEKYRKLKWLKAEDLERVREIERERDKHGELLKSDPWYQASEVLIDELKKDKHLSKFDLEFTRYRPFLIAKQRKNPSTDAFKIRILGEMLQAAAVDFVKVFSKDLGLKPLDNVEFKGKASVLPIIYFEDKYSFERYHLDQGQKIPEGAAAYFMPSNNRIVYYEGEGQGSEQFNLNKMVHELTHQLVWFYTPSRSRCQLHFFQEGIAEFFAGTSRKSYTNKDGERSYHYTFRGKLKSRMKHLKHARITHWFTFADLMQTPDKFAMDRLCKKKAGDDKRKQRQCGSLFYAEAWSLFYFLWHHKDGVYRPNLIKYVGMELEGKTGLRHFRAAFEGVNLREVGRKWRTFVNSSGPFLEDI